VSNILGREAFPSVEEPYAAKFLLECGVEPSCMDGHGNTALHKLANFLQAFKSTTKPKNIYSFWNDIYNVSHHTHVVREEVMIIMERLYVFVDFDEHKLPDTVPLIVEKYARTLLEFGAHADFRNSDGKVACEMLNRLLEDGFQTFQHQTLLCLSARALHKINFPPNLIPVHLAKFVSIH
jgi:hypothetical protein